MPITKSYSVRFSNSNIGSNLNDNQQLRDVLADQVTQHGRADRHGHHLPAIEMEGEHFQVRNLSHMGRFWRGSFARLRDEAPHVIGATNIEREIDLEAGDRILEKTFFLYYEDTDIVVFQMSRNVGYLSRFAYYWSRLLNGVYVDFPPVIDADRLQEILGAGIREVNFTYARSPGSGGAGPRWTQRAMEMLMPVHGASRQRHQQIDRKNRLSCTWASLNDHNLRRFRGSNGAGRKTSFVNLLLIIDQHKLRVALY